MKFKIYDLIRNRYLSDEELEGYYYNTGQFDREFPPNEYTKKFKINLLTGSIQTNQDNSCTDVDCCTPCEMFADDLNFILEFDTKVVYVSYK